MELDVIRQIKYDSDQILFLSKKIEETMNKMESYKDKPFYKTCSEHIEKLKEEILEHKNSLINELKTLNNEL